MRILSILDSNRNSVLPDPSLMKVCPIANWTILSPMDSEGRTKMTDERECRTASCKPNENSAYVSPSCAFLQERQGNLVNGLR